MDVAGITAAGAAQMAVLKMAIELEGQGALQLVQAAAQTAASNPPNLGNSVDTYA